MRKNYAILEEAKVSLRKKQYNLIIPFLDI